MGKHSSLRIPISLPRNQNGGVKDYRRGRNSWTVYANRDGGTVTSVEITTVFPDLPCVPFTDYITMILL